MKQLLCEMCGSKDLVKQEGVFVCQSCGCKYSVEEAKKMMIEGTVEVTGTVKVDDEKETLNLKQLASNAKNRKDYKEAAKYYNELLLKEPNSWETNYYTVYAQAMDIKVGEIPKEITRVSNNIPMVFSLINKSNYTSSEKVDIIKEIGKSFFELTILFFENYKMEGSLETRIKILEAQEDFYIQICDHFSDDKEFMDAYGTNLLLSKLNGVYIFEEEILSKENHLYYTHDCKNVCRPSDFVQDTIKKTNARCENAIEKYNPKILNEVQQENQLQQGKSKIKQDILNMKIGWICEFILVGGGIGALSLFIAFGTEPPSNGPDIRNYCVFNAILVWLCSILSAFVGGKFDLTNVDNNISVLDQQANLFKEIYKKKMITYAIIVAIVSIVPIILAFMFM